jgi:hypothetical protein
MEVVPPARIPANTVEVRAAQLCDAHAWRGSRVGFVAYITLRYKNQ